MKKGYSKPMVYLESFELDTAIASCGAGANSGSWYGKPYHGDPDTCYFGLDGVGEFSDSPSSPCAADKNDLITEIPKDLDGEYYCYHEPSGELKIFAS